MKNSMIMVLLLAFTTSGAFAFGGGGKKGKGGKGQFKQILKQLELTDEQKDKLKSIRKENKDKYRMTKGEMKELHEKLEDGFSSNSSESELQGLHTKIKEIRIKKMDKRFNRMMSIRSVLNETQRKRFFELHKSMRKNKRGK